MAKLLLADENFPFPAVQSLREKGHDVVTLLDLGKTGQAIPDEEVLDLAIGMQRAVLTINRKHFIRLHNQNNNHKGIVVCTLDVNFRRLAENIDNAISTLPSLDGRLIRINKG